LPSEEADVIALVDTHLHLDEERLTRAHPRLLEEAKQAGVRWGVSVGTRPSQWQRLEAIRALSGDWQVAVGIHPQCLPEMDAAELAQGLATLASEAKRLGAVAIGECGFDGGTARGHAAWSLARQAEIVGAQLDVAEQLALPLLVHVQDAMGPALAYFEKRGALKHGAVLHAFGGPAELITRWAKLGFYFGLGPSVTWTKSKKPKEAARRIPMERILFETDAPYSFLEGSSIRQGEPAHVAEVARYVAELRGVPFEEMARVSTENACRLFRR
jgi:TatD DNase family protein